MSVALQLVNGVPRTFTIPGTSLIYDQSVSIVVSGGNGSTTLNGPVNSGTTITLPGSGTYTFNVNSVPNLNVYLNGDRLESVIDWNTSGAGPNFTAIQLTFQVVAGDRLDFRIERTS